MDATPPAAALATAITARSQPPCSLESGQGVQRQSPLPSVPLQATALHQRRMAVQEVSALLASVPDQELAGVCFQIQEFARLLRAQKRQSSEDGSAVIRFTAIRRAAQLADEHNRQREVMNQRMLGHLCTHTPVDDCELLLHMLGRQVAFDKSPEMLAAGIADKLAEPEPVPPADFTDDEGDAMDW